MFDFSKAEVDGFVSAASGLVLGVLVVTGLIIGLWRAAVSTLNKTVETVKNIPVPNISAESLVALICIGSLLVSPAVIGFAASDIHQHNHSKGEFKPHLNSSVVLELSNKSGFDAAIEYAKDVDAKNLEMSKNFVKDEREDRTLLPLQFSWAVLGLGIGLAVLGTVGTATQIRG